MANLNIDILKDRFRDWARPNLFTFGFTPPAGLAYSKKEYIETAGFGATFPAVNVNDLSFKRMGVNITVPGDVTFGELSVTLGNDIDMVVRTFITDWIALIKNVETGTFGRLVGARSGKVHVTQLDGALKPIYVVEFIDAFPLSMSEIQLSTDTENTMETFTVSFAYSYQRVLK